MHRSTSSAAVEEIELGVIGLNVEVVDDGETGDLADLPHQVGVLE